MANKDYLVPLINMRRSSAQLSRGIGRHGPKTGFSCFQNLPFFFTRILLIKETKTSKDTAEIQKTSAFLTYNLNQLEASLYVFYLLPFTM